MLSLKSRLRIAVVVLMSVVVIVLSLLYLRFYVGAAFSGAADVAEATGTTIQQAILDTLRDRIQKRAEPPPDTAAAKQFWLETIETDPEVGGILLRSIASWEAINEIYIADENGRIRASSNLGQAGKPAPAAIDFSQWQNRTFIGNLWHVFRPYERMQATRLLSVPGETKPFISINIVMSSLFLRNRLMPGLEDLLVVFIASLLISVALAMVLPNVVVGPIERLNRNLDLMATGKFAMDAPARRESKEFAAVYDKLNLLGQQYKGARQDVQELRGNIEQLVQRMEQTVLLFDPKGRLLMAGKQVRRLLEQEPEKLVGRAMEDVFPPDTEIGSLIKAAVETQTPVRDKAVQMAPGDFLLTVEPLGSSPADGAIGTLVTFRDAESRGQLVAHLDLAARLTALSQLTRGVAHEIKNPLNAITLHLEVLRNRLDDDSPEVDVIGREISRLDRVVKTFLDFNRPVQPHMRPLNLSEMACEIGRLVEPDASARKIVLSFEEDPPQLWIEGDPDLLKQAVLNVVMNGMEAMKDGGRLALRTRREAQMCLLEVIDNGPGIPPAIQDKIFNLYFSTKQQGSGIGLAMAFRFVQLHDGKIEFTTQPGLGTTFRFLFSEAASHPAPTAEISRSQRA